MSDLPKRVSISEEGPREGFQSEKKMIPVADKVRLIEALAETGLRHIACVSYVNPKRVPTMADAEEVAQAIRQKPGIEYSALWLNQQGLERALRGPIARRWRRPGHRLGHLLEEEHRQGRVRRAGRAAPVAQDLQGPRHAGRMGHHPRRLRLQLRGRALDRLILHRVQQALDEAELAGFSAQGHQAHRRHGLGDAASVYRLIGAIRNKWPELEISAAPARHARHRHGGRPTPACSSA
jgi:hydroxymethylglutaryl-CoA lyase